MQQEATYKSGQLILLQQASCVLYWSVVEVSLSLPGAMGAAGMKAQKMSRPDINMCYSLGFTHNFDGGVLRMVIVCSLRHPP